MEFKLGIINYHYIREHFPSRGIFGVTPTEFRFQLLELLKNRFNFISLFELESAIQNKSIQDLPNKSIFITFDDGLRESYEIGKPILDRLSVPAGYFISTGGIIESKVLNVHALHLIQQHMTYEEISKLISDEMFFKLKSISERTVQNQYPWDDLDTSRLKYLFNFLLDEEEKRNLVHICLANVGLNEVELRNRLYMSKEQIKNLSKIKWLGSHGISHTALSSLTTTELTSELAGSKEQLESIGGDSVKTIAYPYGGHSSFNDNVLTKVEESGFECGLTMLRGFNTENEIIKTPLLLRRFDTNDLYGGKSHSKYVEFFHD